MQIIGTRYVRFCFLDGLAWRLGRTRHWGKSYRLAAIAKARSTVTGL